MGSNSVAFFASLMSHVRAAPVIGHTACEMQMLLFFHKLVFSHHDLEENEYDAIFYVLDFDLERTYA